MSLIDGLRYRLRVLLRRDAFERELDDEIRFHMSLARQQSDADAAERRFGNVTYMKEEVRRMSWLALADTTAQDVRFAVRTFARRPAFTVAALATIALGIGAATAIYSVADGVLFRPFRFRDSDRLITVWRTRPEARALPEMADRWDHGWISLPEYRDWAAAQKSFSDVALFTGINLSITTDAGSDSRNGYEVTASFLPTLGIAPILGRNFTEAEDRVGGAPVTLMSYQMWATRYGSSPSVLTQTVKFDDTPYSIVGVLPDGIELGRGKSPGAFWIPAGQDAARSAQRGFNDFRAIGRLKPGATIEAATAEAAHVFADPGASVPMTSTPRLAGPSIQTQNNSRDTPSPAGAHLEVWRLDETRAVRAPLLILLGAAGLLLVIACVNVATLLLGEAATRQAEVAARMALGAGRARLFRQLLAESLTISLLGAVLGVALASWGVKGLIALAPNGIPGLRGVSVDARVLAVTASAALLTGALFGLVPAFTLSSATPAMALHGRGGSRRGSGRLQQWFVGAQVTLSFVLLVGAGLLGRSFAKLTSVDPGFRAEGLVEIDMGLPRVAYPDSTAIRAFFRDATARLAALPGVTGAAATNGWTFSRSNHSSDYQIEGRAVDPAVHTNAERRAVTPGFFALAGVRIVQGRPLVAEDAEGTPPVIVISEALARREFRAESPLGQRIKFMGALRTVVGVANDVKFQRLSNDDPGTIYAPASQMCCFSPNLLVRTAGDPSLLSPSIRAALKDVAPQVSNVSISAMTGLVRATYAEERYRTTLMAIFAIVAAVLAALGLYGVTVRAVVQRVREVAIRVALGATGWSVVGLVMRRSALGVAVGMAVGMLGALAAARVLTPYLFGVTASDPTTYLGIMVLLAVVSLVASWVPARRATRVQPVEVLRAE